MPTTETRRLNPLMLWGIFLAIIVPCLHPCSARPPAKYVEIRAAAVTRQNLVSSVSTNGKVEPIGEFQAYAPSPGVIAKVYVEVLQKVKAGDLLIKMDDSDAVAKLAAANATFAPPRPPSTTWNRADRRKSTSPSPEISAGPSCSSSRQPKISPPSSSSSKKAQPPPARSPPRKNGCKPPTAPCRAFNRAAPSATAPPTRPASRHRSPTPAQPSPPHRAAMLPSISGRQ